MECEIYVNIVKYIEKLRSPAGLVGYKLDGNILKPSFASPLDCLHNLFALIF